MNGIILLDLRTVLLFRILRILKRNRYMESITAIGEVFRWKPRKLAPSCIFIPPPILFSSLLMYHAEHEVQPDRIRERDWKSRRRS